ncbi:Protein DETOXIFICATION 42 [Hondaea fermentalgiana]|uniref:Protein DETOXIFICATION 42 n=1 Tax=Hondaea fermentalgiana TaxID=2315210 RepID=A0A2R5GPZ5_9STRA|nr:Protein DETOXIFICATION 42 [Hondaea fermentalgiana]|eukprot:GBG32937.1 Protein DETOXIFICATION 42 [Hondaea fermentalgiana]
MLQSSEPDAVEANEALLAADALGQEAEQGQEGQSPELWRSRQDEEELETKSWCELARLSAVAALNDAVTPTAALVELVLVSHAYDDPVQERTNLAAYSTVVTVCTFFLNIFNFVIVVSMANVGRAVGMQYWEDVGSRVRLAATAALGTGIFCALALVLAQNPIYSLYRTAPEVQDAAHAFYNYRVWSTPFVLLTRTWSGVLSGYQCVHTATVFNSMLAAATICGNFVGIVLLGGGLKGCAVATFVVSVLGAVAGLLLVLWCAPNIAVNTQLLRIPLLGRSEADERATDAHRLVAYWRSAANMLIRSFLLAGSLWVLAVLASRLGPTELAAHQVLLQLWTLTSYLADGFADVGTMLGSKLLGADRARRVIPTFDRLLAMGSATGVVFCVVFFLARDVLIAAFTSDDDTRAALRTVWPLLSLMQLCNAVVFVYDGLIYATQAFHYVRNIMLAGSLLLFLPLVVFAYYTFHSLLSIWFAKAVLNLWRALGAVYVIHFKFYPRWRAS